MIGIDTNVLVYAEGVNDTPRQARALDIITGLPTGIVVIPVQVLGELFRVLTAKVGRNAADARSAILSWRDAHAVRETSSGAFLSAMDLVVDHRMSIWDALILAVTAEAGCRILLSEDMHEGFTWRGVTVVNPFANTVHPLLASLMSAGRNV
jgi:predicted nucleic acid-binding protein